MCVGQFADLAQLVEHRYRKPRVRCSNHLVGTRQRLIRSLSSDETLFLLSQTIPIFVSDGRHCEIFRGPHGQTDVLH